MGHVKREVDYSKISAGENVEEVAGPHLQWESS